MAKITSHSSTKFEGLFADLALAFPAIAHSGDTSIWTIDGEDLEVPGFAPTDLCILRYFDHEHWELGLKA